MMTQGTPRTYYCECRKPIVGIIRWQDEVHKCFTEWHAGTVEESGQIVTICPACGTTLSRFLSDKPGAKTVAASMLHRFGGMARLEYHVCGQEIIWMYSFPSRGWKGYYYAVSDPGGPALEVCPTCKKPLDGKEVNSASRWEDIRKQQERARAAPAARPASGQAQQLTGELGKLYRSLAPD